ncbi:GNAT family N-acetyltransferase [Massilia phyllosphaerae]|uniref:GNAT family N-acetyltransferase n=1 Tax=Massilia phyllosphaerae TaxID=3106034 RepID=UPI002B1CBCD1|nr:GNAT family protein [Massilia sp. SGZ-792]
MPLLDLQPLSDQGALAPLFLDPYIARVGHDDRPAAPIDHPHVHYLGARVDGELVGAFMVIESGFVEVDVHALLTRRALPHSRALGRLCLAQAFANPEIQRVTAYVIEGLSTARNYCRKLGFKDEGARRQACRKGGRLLDVHILGITRIEWKESQ